MESCRLVTCADLKIPHHQDTHAREDKANANDCRLPVRTKFQGSGPCWQCRDA